MKQQAICTQVECPRSNKALSLGEAFTVSITEYGDPHTSPSLLTEPYQAMSKTHADLKRQPRDTSWKGNIIPQRIQGNT